MDSGAGKTRMVSAVKSGVHRAFGGVAVVLILVTLFLLLSGGYVVVMEFLGVPPSAYMTTGDH